VAGNRRSSDPDLEAFFLYSHEQGFSERRLAGEELFHESTLTLRDGA